MICTYNYTVRMEASVLNAHLSEFWVNRRVPGMRCYCHGQLVIPRRRCLDASLAPLFYISILVLDWITRLNNTMMVQSRYILGRM